MATRPSNAEQARQRARWRTWEAFLFHYYNDQSGLNATNVQEAIDELAGGAGAVVVSATEPASPADGSWWFDLTTATLLLRVNDGTSTQWIEPFGGRTNAIAYALIFGI